MAGKVGVAKGGAATLGRRRTGDKRPAPAPGDDRIAIIHLKGSVEYGEWLDALHRKTHIPKASLFRVALAEWAEKNGHPSPPEM